MQKNAGMSETVKFRVTGSLNYSISNFSVDTLPSGYV